MSKLHLMSVIKAATLMFFISSSVSASETEQNKKTEQINRLLQEVAYKISQLANSEESDIKDFHYVAEIPARSKASLGLTLDPNYSNRGLKVLSVLPGSTSDESGIMAGDLLVDINGNGISQENAKERIAELASMSAGESVTLGLVRGNEKLTKSLRLNEQYIPSVRVEVGDSSNAEVIIEKSSLNADACGRVSVFFTPPKALDLYPVTFYTIDGEGVLTSRHSFKLPVGKHRIQLHEQIDDFRLKRRSKSIVQRKELIIDVQENTTYYLAAKFDSSEKLTLDNDKIWEPIVWKQVENRCD